MIFLFILDRLGSFSQTLHLEALSSFQKLRQLILCDIDLSGIHKFQYGCQVLKWDVLQDDDRVLSGVLFEQSLEIGGAGGQNHLVGLAALSVAGEGHVTKRLLIPQMFEGGNHVGLEIVPSQTELLLVIHFCCLFSEIDFELFIVILITLRRYELNVFGSDGRHDDDDPYLGIL